MRRTLLIAALAVTASASAAPANAAPLPASAFAYDASAPLGLTTVRQTISSGAHLRDVRFASPRGGTMHGVIVSPSRAVNGPGVLFVHWLGDPQTTNFTEFQSDAIALAQRGVTSLMIDAMWSKPHWFEKLRTTATDYDASINQVIELRRSLDVLLAQPGVDRNRIAYVGHDFGAMYGAVLSGVDARPHYYVLMAGTTSFSEWYLLGPKPGNIQAYVQQMEPLEPLQYLALSQARDFLFQFSQKDEYIAPEKAAAFVAAAPAPRASFFYLSTHALAEARIHEDRLRWLRSRLSI